MVLRSEARMRGENLSCLGIALLCDFSFLLILFLFFLCSVFLLFFFDASFPISPRLDFPEEEMKFRACRMIGAFLPKWRSCLSSFSLIGSFTTPESTAAWETLPVEISTTTTSNLKSLGLGSVTTSTDCLASHFVESPKATAFFSHLGFLDLRLRGDFDKIALPLKVCVSLTKFHLAFEYFSESSPFQIGKKQKRKR